MNTTDDNRAVASSSGVLPVGIFAGVKEWDQIGKQTKVREYLETLPNSAIFRSGHPPKRKPPQGRIHSTCGCWQCKYCTSIIVARALRDVRTDRWQNVRGSASGAEKPTI